MPALTHFPDFLLALSLHAENILRFLPLRWPPALTPLLPTWSLLSAHSRCSVLSPQTSVVTQCSDLPKADLGAPLCKDPILGLGE
jgi:hypothetical protein